MEGPNGTPYSLTGIQTSPNNMRVLTGGKKLFEDEAKATGLARHDNTDFSNRMSEGANPLSKFENFGVQPIRDPQAGFVDASGEYKVFDPYRQTILPNGQPIDYAEGTADLQKLQEMMGKIPGVSKLFNKDGEKGKGKDVNGTLGGFGFEETPVKNAPTKVATYSGGQGNSLADLQNLMGVDPSSYNANPSMLSKDYWNASPYRRDWTDNPAGNFWNKYGGDVTKGLLGVLMPFTIPFSLAGRGLEALDKNSPKFNADLYNKLGSMFTNKQIDNAVKTGHFGLDFYKALTTGIPLAQTGVAYANQ